MPYGTGAGATCVRDAINAQTSQDRAGAHRLLWLPFSALMWLNASMASTPSFNVADLRRLPSYEQVHWLVRWFETTFFDPEKERRAGVNRRYRWPPSGPIDPLEELVIAFGNFVDRSILSEAATDLSRRSKNWNARPDEMPEESRLEGRFLRAGDRAGMRLWTDAEQLRTELLAKIELLEAAVARLEIPPASYSHNGPPEPLDDLPATRMDVAELSKALVDLRAEAQASRPAQAALRAQSSKLLAFSKKVADWSGIRANKFVDAALDTAGKTAGAAFVLSVTGLLPHIHEVVSAIEKFVQALGH